MTHDDNVEDGNYDEQIVLYKIGSKTKLYRIDCNIFQFKEHD